MIYRFADRLYQAVVFLDQYTDLAQRGLTGPGELADHFVLASLCSVKLR